MYGLYLKQNFISECERAQIVEWLKTIHPIWEKRYRQKDSGKATRELLRPVYWLGSWQFACLNYYRPPNGVKFRCIEAEPFPPILKKLCKQMEAFVHKNYQKRDVPIGWKLNSCLVNLYGKKKILSRWVDTARVGEHKDFEPGPVASLSLGERALFQFVKSGERGHSRVIYQEWLDDRSLQIFGGERWKRHFFHRVQRVDRKMGVQFPMGLEDFQTRRVNFTFRFVPDEHTYRLRNLPNALIADIKPYIEELSKHTSCFRYSEAL